LLLLIFKMKLKIEEKENIKQIKKISEKKKIY